MKTILRPSRGKNPANEGQKGFTTVEYAVAGALITTSIVVAFVTLGDQVTNLINATTGAFN